MKINIDWKVVVIAIALVGLTVFSGIVQIRNLRQAAAISQLEAEGQRQLSEYTSAKLAAQTDLTTLYRTMSADLKQINSQLVGALRIAVAERDTVIVNSQLPTTVLSDSTRVANFRDSTFAGVIEGAVTAPPFPSPLGISYTLTRPAFTPEIGFSKVGDRYVASVNWQGEQFEIRDVFFDDKKIVDASKLDVRAEARYYTNERFQANLMGVVPISGWEIQGGYGADVRHKESTELGWFFGAAKSFRIF